MSLLVDRWCKENPSLAIIEMDLLYGLMLIEGPPESFVTDPDRRFMGVRWAACTITNKEGIMVRSNCDYFECIDDARRVYESRLADEIHFATYCCHSCGTRLF